jgi:hypothetical protein
MANTVLTRLAAAMHHSENFATDRAVDERTARHG